jgi:hypothetical protein
LSSRKRMSLRTTIRSQSSNAATAFARGEGCRSSSAQCKATGATWHRWRRTCPAREPKLPHGFCVAPSDLPRETTKMHHPHSGRPYFIDTADLMRMFIAS